MFDCQGNCFADRAAEKGAVEAMTKTPGRKARQGERARQKVNSIIDLLLQRKMILSGNKEKKMRLNHQPSSYFSFSVFVLIGFFEACFEIRRDDD